jgi:hypothetical protein
MNSGGAMQQTQHTPGPWTADSGDGQYYGVFRESDGGGICYLSEPGGQLLPTDRNWPEHEANARLIAAAPDLLAALRNIIAAPRNASRAFIHEIARAAIAKAEGA